MFFWLEIQSLRDYCEGKDYINAQLFEQYREHKVQINERIAEAIAYEVCSVITPNPEQWLAVAKASVLKKLKYLEQSKIVDVGNT